MIGESRCLIAYFFMHGQKQKDSDLKSPEAPRVVFLVACILDWTATTLVNMAYVFIAASVVQMTRGAVVIFTCLFSVLFLQKPQRRYHVAGVFLVFLGITLVSLSTLLKPAGAAD